MIWGELRMNSDQNTIWSAYIAAGKQAYELGKYAEAEAVLTDNLHELEELLANREIVLSDLLLTLANINRDQDKFEPAEDLFSRAIGLREKHAGPSNPGLIPALKEWSLSLSLEGRFSEAFGVERKILAICERSQFKHQRDLTNCLARLAALSFASLDFERAELYYKRLLKDRERQLGKEHPDLIPIMSELAVLSYRLDRFDEAEKLFQRALTLKEKKGQAKDRETADLLNGLGLALCAQGKNHEAQPFCRLAAELRDSQLPETPPDMACELNELADVYCQQERFNEARSLCDEALAIRQMEQNNEGGELASALSMYAKLLRQLSFTEKAEKIEQRVGRLRIPVAT